MQQHCVHFTHYFYLQTDDDPLSQQVAHTSLSYRRKAVNRNNTGNNSAIVSQLTFINISCSTHFSWPACKVIFLGDESFKYARFWSALLPESTSYQYIMSSQQKCN